MSYGEITAICPYCNKSTFVCDTDLMGFPAPDIEVKCDECKKTCIVGVKVYLVKREV